MINPLTPIAAAAASVGITSTIEVGNEQELNLVLHNQTDFPLLALVRTGIDAERNTFVPSRSYSYNTKHVCLCYLLNKSNLDDTGTARNTAIQALYTTAMQLAARIQTDGATSVQLRQPGKLSLSALNPNMFDLNLDGVIFMAEIPDNFTYCITPSVTFGAITVDANPAACTPSPVSVDITVDEGTIYNVQGIYTGAATGSEYLAQVGDTWSYALFQFDGTGTVALVIRVTFTDGSTQDSDPVNITTTACGGGPSEP